MKNEKNCRYDLATVLIIAFASFFPSPACSDSELSSPAPLATESQESNLHMQATTVSQQHNGFTSPYSSVTSLTPDFDSQTSVTWTFFYGRKLWQNAEFYANPELTGGSGFNKTQGLAGFPNAEIYRVDDPSPKWSFARLYLKQTFGFGDQTEDCKDEKNQLAGSRKVERLTVIAGKFALNDFFDSNTYAHDPRTQFLNWALMDNGAWDYAADTRGYSWGLYLEYNQFNWTVRFASVMVPKEANQMRLEEKFPQFRGDNVEFEYRYSLFNKPGVTRALAYENYANMGNYRNTLNTPTYANDITLARSSSMKYGFGINLEQEINDNLGFFAKASWNDGRTETWAFTEIDSAFSTGISLKGNLWNRKEDGLGFAYLANGLSNDHRDYLATGGHGFIVGDGQLNYASEQITEIYYRYSFVKNLDLTGDYQYVSNPAYNKDRGPVSIMALRIHYEM